MKPTKKNEFDRQLADKFNDFSPEVPAGLWDKIETQLAAQEHRPIVPLQKKRQFPTWWMSVAAAVLVVCGIAYWYNRPVTITYLHGRVAQAEDAGNREVDVPAQEPLPSVVEPLDLERLKRVFAKRDRKVENKNPQDHIITEAPRVDAPTECAEIQQLATNDVVLPSGTPATTKQTADTPAVEQAITVKEIAATVPNIQPLVVLEEEEETQLASAGNDRQPFGISNILNYVVGTVDQRTEKLITFSNDNEGSLKLDFNFSLAKNKKKKRN